MTPRSPGRWSPTASRSRTRPRHSGWRATRPPAPSAWSSSRNGTPEEDGARDVVLLHQLGGGPLEANLTLLQEHRSVAQLGGDVQALLDDDQGDTVLAHPSDDLQQLADDDRGQSERQLVDAQQRGIEQQRLGQGQLLLLAAGKPPGLLREPFGQTGERGEHELSALS